MMGDELPGDGYMETTETSVFVCSTDPQPDWCVAEVEPEVTPATVGPATVAVVEVPPVPPAAHRESLPRTGAEGSLAFLGAGLVAVGLALLRRGK